LKDENYLTGLYLSHISRKVDKDRVQEAHPKYLAINNDKITKKPNI